MNGVPAVSPPATGSINGGSGSTIGGAAAGACCAATIAVAVTMKIGSANRMRPRSSVQSIVALLHRHVKQRDPIVEGFEHEAEADQHDAEDAQPPKGQSI